MNYQKAKYMNSGTWATNPIRTPTALQHTGKRGRAPPFRAGVSVSGMSAFAYSSFPSHCWCQKS